MSSEAPFGMTDLEKQLLAGDGESVRQQVLSRLDALEAAMLSELKAGATPARYEELSTICTSLGAARRVVLGFSRK